MPGDQESLPSMPSVPVSLSWHAMRNRLLRYGKRLRTFSFFENSSVNFRLAMMLGTALLSCWFVFWLILGAGPSSTTLGPATERQQQHYYFEMPDTERSELGVDPDLDQKVDAAASSSHVTELESLVKLGMIYNESDRLAKEAGFQQHAFNTLVSERIGLRRQLPDTRHHACLNQGYPTVGSLDTSVIVCFFEEHFATLLRTVYSLLEQTEPALLREVILVDDHSQNGIGDQLRDHRQSLVNRTLKSNTDQLYLSKVHYYRAPERSGLIRARLYGAQFATGKVLFFVDSHCEMNRNWLPPLLARIGADRKLVVCPIIDLIDPDTFRYSASPIVKGGFQWGLHFKWDSVPSELLQNDKDFVKPIKSPAMAGGLFAIERDYFYELGGYDRGMDIWGGENIELSLRIWMCGGQLEIVPCSRVGHVFRRRRPYGSPDGTDTLAYNSIRAARVWMDDYLKYFLESRSDLASMSYGNIDPQLQLRSRLNCSSFEWYLRNVYPELLTPDQLRQKMAHKAGAQAVNLFGRKQPKVMDKFRLQLSVLSSENLCIESDSEVAYKGGTLSLKPCSNKLARRQIWKQSAVHDLRLGAKSCLEALQAKQTIKVGKCHEMGGTQHWQFDSKNHTRIYNVGSGLCLTAITSQPGPGDLSDARLAMSFCKDNDDDNTSTGHTFLHWNLISS